MAETLKVISTTTTKVPSTWVWEGKEIIESPRSYTSSVSARAIWHRPKPPFLLTTGMVVFATEHNTDLYNSVKKHPVTGKLNGRIGAVDYVYPGASQTLTTSDNGSAAVNRALSGFTNKKGTYGEGLVEVRSTADLLQKRGRQLINLVHALRSRDVKKLERIIDSAIPRDSARNIKKMEASKLISDGYLEVQFGVLPLIQMLQDTAQNYNDGLYKNGQSVKSGSGKIIRTLPKSREEWTPQQGRARFRGTVSNSVPANLNALGLLNIPLEVWNAVPLSFVFDWGANVGTFLGAITGSAGLDLTGTQVGVTDQVAFKLPVTGTTALLYRSRTITRSPILVPTAQIPESWAREANISFGKVVTLFALGRSLVLRSI